MNYALKLGKAILTHHNNVDFDDDINDTFGDQINDEIYDDDDEYGDFDDEIENDFDDTDIEIESDMGAEDSSNNFTVNSVSFGSSIDIEERDVAKSKLIDKLQSCHIDYSRIYSDNTWGGIDSYSGNNIKDDINRARNNNLISDSEFNELLGLLIIACHSL